MNLTTTLGLAKPAGGENYDVDLVNANSDKIDDAIGGHEARLDAIDSGDGWISGAGIFTPLAGFSISGSLVKKYGDVVSVQINMVRTGATLAAGNIANQDMVQISNNYKAAQANGSFGGGPNGPGFSGYLSATGIIVMTTLDTALSSGDSFHIFGVYVR